MSPSPGKNAWRVQQPIPSPRFYTAAAAGLDGRPYIVGGQDTRGYLLNTVESFSWKGQ